MRFWSLGGCGGAFFLHFWLEFPILLDDPSWGSMALCIIVLSFSKETPQGWLSLRPRVYAFSSLSTCTVRNLLRSASTWHSNGQSNQISQPAHLSYSHTIFDVVKAFPSTMGSSPVVIFLMNVNLYLMGFVAGSNVFSWVACHSWATRIWAACTRTSSCVPMYHSHPPGL